MGKDKNDHDATEDTWTFDGRAFQKKNEKIKTLLESKGGPNLVRHYTGEYSCNMIQAKIVELAPIEGWETEAGWGEDGANWEEGSYNRTKNPQQPERRRGFSCNRTKNPQQPERKWGFG